MWLVKAVYQKKARQPPTLSYTETKLQNIKDKQATMPNKQVVYKTERKIHLYSRTSENQQI
ncbi:hypothetical protein I79_012947 [Cricetulus griseus]|uniref:Uncharacterized protein n=1 Tax=Cricetulus griseus TaxID=10029 RepID=G3HQ53_CRIGR|nr:hypothetical protein I79_012947 [Cricetulus griseus]